MSFCENAPKVSVIIPVYNVEAYIARCARSLFEQTLDEIEYIFVNDCSPDESMQVLRRTMDEYPHRCPQVKIIDLPANQGAAKAREIGIKAAKGEYIIQCDSDDFVDRDMYRTMYAKAFSEGLDLVMCRQLYYFDGTNKRLVTDKISDDKYMLLADIVCRRTSVSLWSRLVKRELMLREDILYPTTHMMEDMFLSAQLTYYSKKYGCVEEPYYHYFENPDSICGETSEQSCIKRWSESKKNVDGVLKFLKSNNLYTREIKKGIIHTKFIVKGFLSPLLRRNNKYYFRWLHTYPRVNIWMFFSKDFSISTKVLFLFTMLGLYPILNRIKNGKTES